MDSLLDFTRPLNKNYVGLGSHEKRRAHTGGIEIGSKPKT
jgi:hypothetical protein